MSGGLRIYLFASGFGVFGLPISAVFARPLTPVHRTDISPAFGKIACEDEVGALPFAAWDAGVHDAQIEGRRITRLGGQSVEPEQLERKARSLARLRGMGGFAFGV